MAGPAVHGEDLIVKLAAYRSSVDKAVHPHSVVTAPERRYVASRQ